MSALQEVGLQEPPRNTETKAKIMVKAKVCKKHSNKLTLINLCYFLLCFNYNGKLLYFC